MPQSSHSTIKCPKNEAVITKCRKIKLTGPLCLESWDKRAFSLASELNETSSDTKSAVTGAKGTPATTNFHTMQRYPT